MSEQKFYWIKLRTNFFGQPEIDFLMGQKNGSDYVVLYQMLCLNTANNNGELSTRIGEVIVPYDVDKIVRDSRYFNRDTVMVALELFKKIGLIYEQEGEFLKIANIEAMVGCESASRNAIKQRAYRERKKGNCDGNNLLPDAVTQEVTNCPTEYRDKSIEIRDKSKDIDIELEKESNSIVSNETICRTEVQRVTDKWNTLSIYGVKPISKLAYGTKRYNSLVARIRQYGVEEVLFAIEKIKESDFLVGKNDKGWTITFDWFVLPNNFVKVHDGNYERKATSNWSQGYSGSSGRQSYIRNDGSIDWDEV